MQVSETGMSTAVVERLWQEYIASGRTGSSFQKKLLDHYYSIAEKTAHRQYAKLPRRRIDVEDLISAGTIGLLQAMKKFDPKCGVKFETYCFTRVRGEILDELRRADWVPRLVRANRKKLEKATRVLRKKLGREPTRDELANHMKLSLKQFSKIERDARATKTVSLNRRVPGDNSHSDDSWGGREPGSFKDILFKDLPEAVDMEAFLELVVRQLENQERTVIILYYIQNMKMKDISQLLEVTESRISHLHGEAIRRLKAELAHLKAEFIV